MVSTNLPNPEEALKGLEWFQSTAAGMEPLVTHYQQKKAQDL